MTSARSVSPIATCRTSPSKRSSTTSKRSSMNAALTASPSWGISQGVPVAIAYAVRDPERVSRLVLCGGFAKGWHRRGNARDVARAEASTTLIREGWGQDNPAGRQMFTSLSAGRDGRGDAVVDELERISASAETAIRLLRVIGDIDIMDHCPDSRFRCSRRTVGMMLRAPFEHGPSLARAIPGALRGARKQESPDPLS